MQQADVGLLDVIIAELDDPNDDGWTTDSFLNNQLLPMLGLPRELAFVRTALQSAGNVLSDVVEPILDDFQEAFGTAVNWIKDGKEAVKGFFKRLLEDRLGFPLDLFEFLLETPAPLDIETVNAPVLVGIDASLKKIYEVESLPIFKPGDREKLDGYL